MVKIGDRVSMVVFTIVGVGTLVSVLLTSQVKKVATGHLREAQQQQQDFDERAAALWKKERPP